MKFEDYRISDEIKRSLSKLGFRKPTDIQFKAIPPIMKGEDVLAIAQTGTGKTAAFAIPVLDRLQYSKNRRRDDGIKCVVMVPTRELALQITEVFNEIGQGTRVNTFCVFGGVEQGPQIAKLEEGIDILVATPGRLFDLVSQGYIKLHRVEVLVLDEADHMLDLGFIHDIRQLIAKLPRQRQTLFFSATINEKIKELAYSLVNKPVRIQISPKDPVAKNVDHSVMYVDMDDKRFFLERVVNENPDKKILAFVRTKVRAERVVAAMDRAGIKAISIHGGKEQKDRTEVMRQFKKGEVKLLVATDVSARGIDIPSVDYVVNYDLPEQPENYVHRVGRTGRGTQKGVAVSFCAPEEKPVLDEIQEYLTKDIKVLSIDKEDYEATIDFSPAATYDWKSLIKEAEETEGKIKAAKAKKAKAKAKKKK
ncbi:DEAD/DEAH box helicase [Pontibacter sp. BT310]|uniref:DEAD/DEAH box helicase n=1 Tax=Pontibacter populi TaxID=890055 RepID=A0ABS6X841_9BACT|nr:MULTISPECIES: DEAD/DEAH box helicase [Pontibacter]MBJ6117306.1 DEAD/DEAH box helicase [Pontibacter sp. BT310]MBR0569731.1 DEAD/DEAH box helicase [Microvirga sp. STS03]MBW3364159.1 DEAD/DEAH box helicase [Pontibacter populi]